MKTVALNILLFSALILSSNFIFSQSWIKTFGGSEIDYGEDVLQTDDEGFIVFGFTTGFGEGTKAYIIKTDKFGDTLWTKTVGDFGGEEAQAGLITNDNSFVFTGRSSTLGIYLAKMNSEGDTLWTRRFADFHEGLHLCQTNDNGYIIAGRTDYSANGGWDINLIKTDENGDTLWTKRFGGPGYDEGNCVFQTTDCGYIISGVTENFGADERDVLLIKTDEYGDTIWTKIFEEPGYQTSFSLNCTNDNGYIITGYTSVDGVGTDAFLIKTNENGDTLWTRKYGGNSADYGYDVKQTNDNGYIVTGHTQSYGNGWSDVYLFKTDQNGNLEWFRTFGENSFDIGKSVEQTNDNGYIITGAKKIYGTETYDIYLIKTDSLGPAEINQLKFSFLELKPIPNPADDFIKLEIPVAFHGQKFNFFLYDLTGKEVIRKKNIITDTYIFKKGNLKHGVYFFRLIFETNVGFFGKIIFK